MYTRRTSNVLFFTQKNWYGIFIHTRKCTPKRTTKHTIEERYDAVTKYLSEQYPRTAISKEYGIGKNTLSNWIRKYKANGIDGLKESQT
ncbi:transposase [Ligilactobacillus animalis]|uniref:transposase n=1 Tax=Ligilactobacillus animalis TaxID=1605 RepID=UPI003C6D645D